MFSFLTKNLKVHSKPGSQQNFSLMVTRCSVFKLSKTSLTPDRQRLSTWNIHDRLLLFCTTVLKSIKIIINLFLYYFLSCYIWNRF